MSTAACGSEPAARPNASAEAISVATGSSSPAAITSPTVAPTDDGPPACALADLELRALFAPPVAGQTSPVGGVLEMLNIGTSQCRVQTKVAWWVGAKTDDIPTTSELGPPAILDPGDKAASALTWWGQECSGTAPLDVIHVEFFSNDDLPDTTVAATGLQRGPCTRPYGDIGSGDWATAVRQSPSTVMSTPTSERSTVTPANATPAPTSRTAPPACTASDLDMRAMFAAPVAGQTSPVAGVLEMLNVGATECRVETLVVWWVGDRSEKVMDDSEHGPPAVIDPGGRAVSALRWSGQECRPGSPDDPLDSIHIAFFGGAGFPDMTVPATGLSRGPCAYPNDDIGFGSWAIAVRRQDFYYPHDVLAQLVPALISPPTAQINVPFSVTLVLTNATDRPASFSHPHPAGATVRCPTISFGIGDLEPDKRTLDCKPGTTIPAGESARYDFEMSTDLDFECITTLSVQYNELPGARTYAPLRACGVPPPKAPAATG